MGAGCAGSQWRGREAGRDQRQRCVISFGTKLPVAKDREMSKKDDSAQIQEILAEEGLASMFGGGGGTMTAQQDSDDDTLRPEDILKSMM